MCALYLLGVVLLLACVSAAGTSCHEIRIRTVDDPNCPTANTEQTPFEAVGFESSRFPGTGILDDCGSNVGMQKILLGTGNNNSKYNDCL